MMKNITKGFSAFIVSFLMSSSVSAVTIPECEIWLCAPYGFGTGCSPAKRALIKRLRPKPEPALPTLLSCAKLDPLYKSFKNKGMNWDHGFAAKMPATTSCRRWDNKGDYCIGGREVIPERMIEGRPCIRTGGDNDVWSPHGCIGTYRYVKVFQYAVQEGTTYYFQMTDKES
jgi:hypothetical protein